MGTTELLGKYESMINELEDNGIYLTTIAYSIIDKHINIEKKEYATECVRASLEKVCENVYCHCCQGDYKGIDYEEVTSPDNIVLL